MSSSNEQSSDESSSSQEEIKHDYKISRGFVYEKNTIVILPSTHTSDKDSIKMTLLRRFFPEKLFISPHGCLRYNVQGPCDTDKKHAMGFLDVTHNDRFALISLPDTYHIYDVGSVEVADNNAHIKDALAQLKTSRAAQEMIPVIVKSGSCQSLLRRNEQPFRITIDRKRISFKINGLTLVKKNPPFDDYTSPLNYYWTDNPNIVVAITRVNYKDRTLCKIQLQEYIYSCEDEDSNPSWHEGVISRFWSGNGIPIFTDYAALETMIWIAFENYYGVIRSKELERKGPSIWNISSKRPAKRIKYTPMPCFVCEKRDADTVILECRHLVFCCECAEKQQLDSRPKTIACPQCMQIKKHKN